MTIRDLSGAFSRPWVSHFLEVVDEKSTTFRAEHNFRIKAKIQTRFFFRQYYWTGSGSVDEQPPELICDYDDWGFPTQKLHGPVIAEKASRMLLVDLGHTLDQGEEVTLKFRHRLKDLNGTFEHRLSSTPKSTTKTVSLEVALPASLAQDVRYWESPVDTGQLTVNDKLVAYQEAEGKLYFKKEIKNPPVGSRRYSISWKSTD